MLKRTWFLVDYDTVSQREGIFVMRQIILWDFNLIFLYSARQHFPSEAEKFCRPFYVPTALFQFAEDPLLLKVGYHL